VVILLENQQQKQEEPVHQRRQKTKSRKKKRTSNKNPVNFDSKKSTRSATISDTSDNSDGNELRLAATILDECETEVKIVFKIVKFHGKNNCLFVIVFCRVKKNQNQKFYGQFFDFLTLKQEFNEKMWGLVDSGFVKTCETKQAVIFTISFVNATFGSGKKSC
jgi:hypothetical protein